MEKLRQYMKEKKVTQAKMAEDAGCSLGMINYVVRGIKSPSIDLALRIQEATGGEVTAKDLIPDHPAWKLVEQKEAVA